MEKKKDGKIITIVALILSVVCISIAYAAMSTTLRITGKAKMDTASWNIKFQNLIVTKTGFATYTEPTLSSTVIANYSVVLTKPGDSVSFAFQIANTGDLDASLASITKAVKPSCTGTGDTAASDEALVCDNIEYTLRYTDGTEIAKGDFLSKDSAKDVVLTLSYKESAADLPKADVVIGDLDVILLYEQAN